MFQVLTAGQKSPTAAHLYEAFSASKRTCAFRPLSLLLSSTNAVNVSQETKRNEEIIMKFKTLLVTLLFALNMWAQTANSVAPTDTLGDNQPKASCCKDGAKCCKDGAGCCGHHAKNASAKGDCCKEGAACCKEGASCCGHGKDMAKADCCKDGAKCCKEGADCCAKMAKGDQKNCCGGKMCDRHKGMKS